VTSGPGEAWFVCGPPGAGKSTLGRTLASAIAATLLDRDTLIGPLVTIVHGLLDLEPADLGSARSRAALGDAPYRTLFDAARDNVAIGGRVVLVAPFTRWLTDPELLAHLPELVGPTTIRVVDAWCPASVRVARLRERAADRAAHRLVAMAGQDSVHLPEEAWSPAVPHIRVDTTRPPHEQLVRARRAPTIG
jgi:predicted kinase